MTEEWRVTHVHPRYEVSNLGNVRSLSRIIVDKNGMAKSLKGKLLKPGPHGSRYDYYAINLGRSAHIAVHILVCTAFNGERPSRKHEVSHIDGNGLNNISTNLEWTTKDANERRKIIHGTLKRGEAHGMAKLTEQQVHNIRQMLANGSTLKQTAEQYGVTFSNIGMIKSRKSWKWLS